MGSDASNLRALLRDALALRLEPAGWLRVGDERDRAMRLATFVRPAGGEFAASVGFMCGFRVPDRPPVRISQPMFGVSYEPLRRLWPLLVEDAPGASLTMDFEDLPEHARVCAEQVGSRQEVAVLADRLAELANAVAIPFAERNASSRKRSPDRRLDVASPREHR